jgi:hypothetical protein
MSSTGPIPPPSAEFFTRSIDVLRQQQQEAIKKLTLAQQQAAKAVPLKPPPTPRMTTEALQATLSDKLTALTTTVQRQQQALDEALVQGTTAPVEAGIRIGQVQGTLESQEQELHRIGAMLDGLRDQQAQESLRLQQMYQQYQQASQVMTNLMKTQHNTVKAIINNLKA